MTGTTTDSDERPAAPMARLPGWSVAVIGALCAGVGVLLVFRPFVSLAVLVAVVAAGMVATGLAAVAAAGTMLRPWLARLAGIGWVAAAVVLVAWPDITTRAVAVVVGVAMIVGGVIDVAGSGGRTTLDRRVAAVIVGVASVIFGVLALSWPDVTVLVVAVVFGARLTLIGLRLVWAAVRPPGSSTRRTPPRRRGGSAASSTSAAPWWHWWWPWRWPV